MSPKLVGGRLNPVEGTEQDKLDVGAVGLCELGGEGNERASVTFSSKDGSVPW